MPFQNPLLHSRKNAHDAPRLRLARLVAIALLSIFFTVQTAAATPPQRVISMAPSITESLFAMGAGDRVVGRTEFCKWPEEACKRTNVGGMLNPSTETWVQLRPDLILFLETSDRMAEKARSLGLKTMMVNMNRIEDIFTSWEQMGDALGIPDQSQALINSVQGKIESIKTRIRKSNRKKTLLLLGDSSDPARDLYAVGPSTFLGQLLFLAGGDNILKDTEIDYPRISKEFILAQSPQVIIEAGPKSNVTPGEYQQRMREWGRYPSIRAVQNKQIYFIGEDYAVLPGPRLHLILRRFAEAIHPGLFTTGADQ